MPSIIPSNPDFAVPPRSGLDDFFSSQDPSKQLAGMPSIGEIKSDMINFFNIANGKAKASDWGAGFGASAGFLLGGPEGAQFGANIGRTVLPVINSVLSPIKDEIGNAVHNVGHGLSKVGHKISKIF